MLLRVGTHAGYWTTVFPAILVIAVGMAGAVAPLTTAVLASVDSRHTGSASGLNSAVARTGGMVATALLGGVLGSAGPALVGGFHIAALVCALASVAAVGQRLLPDQGGRSGNMTTRGHCMRPGPAARKLSARSVVVVALVGNMLVAASKVGAALWTGSASMASEAIHSIVDTSNEILLLYGMRRAARKADPDHPLGYGREIYFWSFVVSLLIFALGAGFSLYEGVARVMQPEPIRSPLRELCRAGPGVRLRGGLVAVLAAAVPSGARAKSASSRRSCSARIRRPS